MKLGASYFGNRTLRHVEKDMEKMVQDGCNLVVHTMSEHDIAYYSQTMIDIVKVSKDIGLEVFLDPWGVGRVFGGESFSTFVKMFPEAKQRLSFNEGEINVNNADILRWSRQRIKHLFHGSDPRGAVESIR